MEHFFSPTSSRDLHSDAHQSQIIGRDADIDHTQVIGGIQSKYWGIYPPHPPGFRHPCMCTSQGQVLISTSDEQVSKVHCTSQKGNKVVVICYRKRNRLMVANKRTLLVGLKMSTIKVHLCS